MAEQFANKIRTTVAVPYTAGSGTLVVADATGMPAIGNFRVRLGNAAGSILRVTARAGTTLTVDVEQDDGNAVVGDTVTVGPTAAAMLALKADAIAGGGGGSSARIFQASVDAPTTGTIAETLYSFTLPAGKLAVNGDAIRITVGCKFAANANAKSAVIAFGATNIVGTGAAGFNNTIMTFVCDVVRLSPTTQKAVGETSFYAEAAVSALGGANTIAATNGNMSRTTPGETLSGAIVIALRALSPALAGDITGLFMFVDFYPAP